MNCSGYFMVFCFMMLCQKEEEKRKQKIEEWENLQDGKGYRSKVKPVSISYMQFQAELEEKETG